MKLKGKKVAFLGDSITEGLVASAPERCYVSMFGKNEGATVFNYGVGGTRIARQLKPDASDPRDEDFIVRSDKIDPDAEIVVVFGGTNDYGHGDAPFGTENDDTVYTFCGACNVLFGKLNRQFPRAVKLALTPLGRDGEETPPVGKRPLCDYAAEVKAAAERNGWYVMDLYSMCRDDSEIAEVRRHLRDGLHPDDIGHALLAEKIAKFLKKIPGRSE